MTMYHGTTLVISKVDLEKSRLRLDFGKGFYLADKQGTAHIWAKNKTIQLGSGIPTILAYTVDNSIYKIHGKRFNPTPEEEWLEFICFNRRRENKGNEPRHDYNWVSGPIANDKVYNVVDNYLDGIIDASEAITRARTLPQTYQLSLHSSLALSYIDEKSMVYKQFKNNGWSKNWVKSGR